MSAGSIVSADFLFAAWFGGALCCAGVLSTNDQLSLAKIVFWSCVWPLSLAMILLEGEA